MNKLEKKTARAIMQIKAEPFCTECGASCMVIMEEYIKSQSSSIWTACSMCGTEMLWTATPNHYEMLERIVALCIEQQGKIIEPYEFIRDMDGSCLGLCGGICSEHWSKNANPKDNNNIITNTSTS